MVVGAVVDRASELLVVAKAASVLVVLVVLAVQWWRRWFWSGAPNATVDMFTMVGLGKALRGRRFISLLKALSCFKLSFNSLLNL